MKSYFNYCPVCGYTNSHRPECPEYQNSDNYCLCTECGKPIYNGESYYEINGEKLCEDCMNDHRHLMDYDDYTYQDYLTEKYERERHDDRYN